MNQQPMNPEVTSDDKLWAALGYPIFIIAIIMLFMEGRKDRPFIKYHAVQALALNVAFWAVEIVINILSSALAKITLFGLGGLVGCITPILWLGLIWPAILAYQGKYFEIPGVTKFLRDQHWIS
jgi:uncharacterized membrane protein